MSDEKVEVYWKPIRGIFVGVDQSNGKDETVICFSCTCGNVSLLRDEEFRKLAEKMGLK